MVNILGAVKKYIFLCLIMIYKSISAEFWVFCFGFALFVSVLNIAK